MYTIKNVKEFLNKKGIDWDYEYLMAFGVVAKANKPEDIATNMFSKVLLINEKGIKQELRVGLNEHKFVIYKKDANNILANEKEENHSTEWQNFLKTKKLQAKEIKESIK